MRSILAVAAGVALTLVPATAQAADARPKATDAAVPVPPGVTMDTVMQGMDKLFPPQPEPAPARLALAKTTAAAMLPNGTYGAMFDDVMGTMVERVLDLKPSDVGVKSDKGKNTDRSLRQEMAREDPYFEERMRITRRVVGEELAKLSAIIEPRLRDGLARSIARRFDERQLTEINAFLMTASGRAFAGQTLRMWVDPDVLRAMVKTVPDLIQAMPTAAARLDEATKHLPKPKKKAPPKDEDEQPSESDSTS